MKKEQEQTPQEREQAKRQALKAAKSKAGMAVASAMFALKETQQSLQELPQEEILGERGAKLMARSLALSLAIEEFERGLDNMQRAIETY